MQPSLTTQSLTPLVQAHLGGHPITILTVEIESLTGGMGEGIGLYRIAGTARQQTQVVDWFLILKILSPATSGKDMGDWNYWRREAHVYELELLTALPGPLATPRCYRVAEQADGNCWIWLEDLGPTAPAWQTEQYWQAAHQLGKFNGHYLTGDLLPDYPWLNRDFLPHWLDRAPGITRLNVALAHPLVRRLYPDDVLEGYHRLWTMRYDLLARLARLPQTFCHLDASPNNLLRRVTPSGSEEFVAIDWAYGASTPLAQS